LKEAYAPSFPSVAADASQGRVLTMKYKDGEKQIEVAPGTPITRMVVADKGILKPGISVTVGTTKTDAGLAANQLIADIK